VPPARQANGIPRLSLSVTPIICQVKAALRKMEVLSFHPHPTAEARLRTQGRSVEGKD
jgi:hypothetical protein